ncbi:hypothetical protein GOP47_0009157 [Adiantum capillus-veneris]|uniref:Uncharacterized protein n=1 Tax=Adiantum capillus-veneris TaxID=13818 RepID=A0A9D4UW78_ADICA|nr:hypothetical protein GOP47_0009157 [Adiantum capillus-veneris]
MALEDDDELWRSPGWLYPAILIASAAVLSYRSRLLSTKDHKDIKPFLPASCPPASFLSSQRKFLGVFFLALAAQDLQIIYGESFLAHKGFKRDRIALFFIFSHLTSLLLGPLIGIVADHIGRKKACVFYCLLQLIGSLTKQSANNLILWSASISHGLATSLLSSTFESWLVAEHEKSGFRQEWISDTFWLLSFGASVVAIGAGGLANYLVGQLSLGVAAPSLAAAVVASFAAFSIFLFWEENPLPSHAKFMGGLKNDIILCFEKKMLLLGCVHACLDFANTAFWFLWTPTLVADGRGLHSGLLFPCLMACEMLGSAVSAMILCGPWNVRAEDVLRWIYPCAAISLTVPAYDYQEIGVLICAFCIFHVCYGISWPLLARLRSIYVPTEHRAAIMTMFQAPAHAVVVFILINGSIYQQLENSRIFGMSVAGLCLGGYCLHLIYRSRQQLLEKFSTQRP